MTTSSPGFQRVTPSPTFQTIPEASEPPMWCSSWWERNTDTGLPSAAHTLLKFTPAAMTRTITSNAPGSGTSISSTWKASIGSPSRSWRMTHAAMVAGSSPGWVSTCATWVRSTAITDSAPCWRLSCSRPAGVGADGTLLAVAVQVTRPAQPRPDHRGRHDHAPDAEHEEANERVDVADEPAEVLAEEADDERERDDDRREHGQPGGDLVEAVRRRLEGHVQRLGEELAAVGDEVDGEDEVVADVGEGMVGLARGDPEHPLDGVGAGLEHVALRHDHLQQPEEAAAHHHDAPAVGVARVGERVLLEPGDVGLDLVQERDEALRERVEDAVDGLVVGMGGGRAHRLERLAAPAVHRDDPSVREVEVHLDRL